ncbi:MAG TPA: patatin-like phospholipase family protein [Candidatus Binatia bacterium]|nr:patatin-like phospholipase family protein [Candidatus Binatia bacterium]
MPTDHANEPNRVTDARSPVREEGPAAAEPLEAGLALCLSGGGYRAMIFHAGVLWRLNEAGYLPRLDRVSSVSGGSITAGVLAQQWGRLAFDTRGVSTAFREEVVAPLRDMAGRTIDAKAIFGGVLLPGSVGEKVAAAYDKHLFKGATLQALPEKPRFVINATNVQSGALWRFSRPYMADYRVGRVDRPTLPLAVAVAASSAFPPVLSPVEIELEAGLVQAQPGADLHREPFTTHVVLSDGGVYDNLGLETAWKRYRTVLVSDAGGKMQAEEEPAEDWARHSLRILDLIDNQVRSLRKRQVIDAFVRKERAGAYWGIRTDIGDYRLADALPCPFVRTLDLANTATRLKRMEPELQERLINWGYAVCDAAVRTHVDPGVATPAGFPYPDRRV